MYYSSYICELIVTVPIVCELIRVVITVPIVCELICVVITVPIILIC